MRDEVGFFQKGLRYWLPYYLWYKIFDRQKPSIGKPIHIFLCVVDHFEPFNGNVDYQTAIERVRAWKKEYPIFAKRHRDTDGNSIQHTWFYPPHLDHSMLPHIVELCQQGYGDIEMHLHHNLMEPFPDTSQTLRDKILKCIDDYGKYGIFCQPEGRQRFAFIHGDWSLDNAMGDAFCGVNDELNILHECGCYADFTFPSINRAQPAMVNRIYYAHDEPDKAKSYNRGTPVQAGQTAPQNALMIAQGILGLRPDKRKRFKFAIDYSDLDFDDPPTKERVDFWVKNSLAIKGKPNWRFIILHTHGGREIRWDANFGSSADNAFRYMEQKYNDGKKYILHYVSARQLYNYIKVLEKNIDFSISDARDFMIKPYDYTV